MEFKHKTYARLSTYGDLVVPTKMLEQLVEHAFLVRTTYADGIDTITEIQPIDKVNMHNVDEIKAAAVQQALAGTD
jgi:hypothetical protein|tara:strand:+ start:9888 stop:10115 length:228 start_codon:yes stop_codon:yes gene_type:complete